MKIKQKIDKIEQKLYKTVRERHIEQIPAENWQQNLMKKIHQTAYEMDYATPQCPLFLKRFAWSSATLAVIMLILFLSTFTISFQTDYDELATDIDTWTVTDDSNNNLWGLNQE